MSNIVDQLYNERGVEIRKIFLENGLDLEPTRENIAKALLVHKVAIKSSKIYDEFIPLIMGAISGIAAIASGLKESPEEKAQREAKQLDAMAIANEAILKQFPDISKAPPEVQVMLAKIKGNPQAFPRKVEGQIVYTAAPTASEAEKKIIDANVSGNKAPAPGESGQPANADDKGATEENFFVKNSKKILIGFGVFVLIAGVIYILRKKN